MSEIATLITGDDSSFPIQLTKDGLPFTIPSDAEIKASLITKDKKSVFVYPFFVSEVGNGQDDWVNSLLLVTFTASATNGINVTTQNSSALIEIQIDDGSKTTWFMKVKLIKGTITTNSELAPGIPAPVQVDPNELLELFSAGDTALHFHNSDRNRANHTGTQLASTISDFDTAVLAAVEVIGGHAPVTTTNSVEIGLTLNEQNISAYIMTGSIASTKLNAAVNNSLALANSALQNADIGVSIQGYSSILTNTTASYTTIDASKLAGIESGATADQSASEIKTLYESNTDTNVFTDTEKTNLANQSGTNTGDQDISGIVTNAAAIAALSSGKQDALDTVTQAEAEAGTSTVERLWTPERVKQAINALASSPDEFLDATFRIVDDVSGFKQIFSTDNLTANRTLTVPDFDLNLNNYFDSAGNLYAINHKFYQGPNTYIEQFANVQYQIVIYGAERHRMSTTSFDMASGINVRWTNHGSQAGATKDTGLSRDSAGVVKVTNGSTGLGEIYARAYRVTTTERDALTGLSGGEIIFNTTTNKGQMFDGTTWNDLY